MHTISTQDLLDLSNVVEYVRQDEEDDFFDNPSTGHIVHSIRNMYALSVGGRTAEVDWSMRMTGHEFDMYSRYLCMWQVDPAAYGRGQYCGRDVVSTLRGFDYEAVFCEEHVEEARDNY